MSQGPAQSPWTFAGDGRIDSQTGGYDILERLGFPMGGNVDT